MGQSKTLLRQLTRGLQLRLMDITRLESKEHGEELRGFSQVLAELLRPSVSFFYLGGSPTFKKLLENSLGQSFQ